MSPCPSPSDCSVDSRERGSWSPLGFGLSVKGCRVSSDRLALCSVLSLCRSSAIVVSGVTSFTRHTPACVLTRMIIVFVFPLAGSKRRDECATCVSQAIATAQQRPQPRRSRATNGVLPTPLTGFRRTYCAPWSSKPLIHLAAARTVPPPPMIGYSRALGAVLLFVVSVSRIAAFVLSSRTMVSCRVPTCDHAASANRARRRRARISMDDEIARKGIKEVWELTSLCKNFYCCGLTALL